MVFPHSSGRPTTSVFKSIRHFWTVRTLSIFYARKLCATLLIPNPPPPPRTKICATGGRSQKNPKNGFAIFVGFLVERTVYEYGLYPCPHLNPNFNPVILLCCVLYVLCCVLMRSVAFNPNPSFNPNPNPNPNPDPNTNPYPIPNRCDGSHVHAGRKRALNTVKVQRHKG